MIKLLPRFIRFRDAPTYLGMDRNRFNNEVRPYITQIPIGSQGIAFDRLDLDAWADHYKQCNGRLGIPNHKNLERQNENKRQISISDDFEKALALTKANRKKSRNI